MHIRAAGLDDVPALARLNAEVHGLHVAGAPERYRAPSTKEVEHWFRGVLAADDSATLIGEIDGEPMGYVIVRRSQVTPNVFLAERHFAYVDQLCVTAGARGHGHGRALMEAAEAQAREWGLATILLDVNGFNEGATRFYQALGYATAGIRFGKRL